MNFCFTGKTFLVTGAGRGIGRALVKALVKSGGKVYALSRTKEPLDSLVKYSDKIYPVVIDISDWDRTRSVVEKLDTFDGVVNNAGYHPGNGLTAALDCPKERFEIAFNTNTLAAVNIIQTVGKKMVQRGNGGSIVNISRYYALTVQPTVFCFPYKFKLC